MSRVRHLRRISPTPATVSRISDVAKDLPKRSVASRKHEVDRQTSEIERLVKLAEQYSAERRQQPAVKSSTTARPMREQTADNNIATQPQCRVTNVHQDVILVPVARKTAAVSATATVSDGWRRRLPGKQSPLTLSPLLDVKSLERCPKCHKVRLDISSSSQDVAASQSHNSAEARRYSPRLVKFKALVGDSSTATAANGHSRSRKTPVKATEIPGVKTALPPTPTFNLSRDSTINKTPFNRYKDHRQSRDPHVPSCSGSVVVYSAREDQQDMNNNYDCESGKSTGRSTWPRQANDCKMLNGDSSTSPGDNGKRSSRLRLPVYRKRSSLSAVQQVWAEESMQRTSGDDEVEQKVDNSPPSDASSYDPLDTVDNTYGYINAFLCVALLLLYM